MSWKQLKQFKSFDNPIFQHMKWLNPKVWEDDNAYSRDSIEFQANHFCGTFIANQVQLQSHNKGMENIQNLCESKF